MRYQVIIPPFFLIPIMMTKRCNTTKNESDVFVRYPHAEAEPKVEVINPVEVVKPVAIEAKTDIQIIVPDKHITEEPRRRKDNSEDGYLEGESNQVVFVPNEREVERNEEYLIRDEGVKVEDYMHRRTMDDVMDSGPVRVETESPNPDILFLSGKNNENENTAKEKKETYGDTRRSGTEKDIIPKLNCTNLDCNNTIMSVCGGKVEHKKWRYRLFLNECFFRKVNCYFKRGVNRFHQVSIDKCGNVGAHVVRPSTFQLYPPASYIQPVREKPIQAINTRRSFSLRRSFSTSVDGKACSHACPVTCPEDYEPECAMSGNGQRRVFVNHCKLDYNSCFYRIAWHRRPLSECVGGKKADMRHNRVFIDWMQRVGIVDNRGRLVLS